MVPELRSRLLRTSDEISGNPLVVKESPRTPTQGYWCGPETSDWRVSREEGRERGSSVRSGPQRRVDLVNVGSEGRDKSPFGSDCVPVP